MARSSPRIRNPGHKNWIDFSISLIKVYLSLINPSRRDAIGSLRGVSGMANREEALLADVWLEGA